MTSAARVRFWIAAALIALGIVVPFAYGHWLKTRIFNPLDKPITLSRGHLSTGDFYINVKGTYWAEIAVDYPFTYKISNPPCPVYGMESAMKFRWKLFQDGKYLGQADPLTYYWFGEFDVGRTGFYRIEIDMLSDASCVNAGHPRIHVFTSSYFYEELNLWLRWVGFFMVLGALGLTFHTLAFVIRGRRCPVQQSTSVLEPSDTRVTPSLRRFPPANLISGMPAFGVFATAFLLCIVVLMMTYFLNRPIPKGLWVSLLKHTPISSENGHTSPITLYLGRYESDSGPSLYLNDKHVRWDQLEIALKQELKTRSEWVVYIDANPDLPFADIVSAIDIVDRMHAKAILRTSREPSVDNMAHYSVKRCTPQAEKYPSLQTLKNLKPREGEKPTGYSPLVAFDILESGETASARIKRSSGYVEVDKQAFDWIRHVKYNRRPGCGIVQNEASVSVHWKFAK